MVESSGSYLSKPIPWKRKNSTYPLRFAHFSRLENSNWIITNVFRRKRQQIFQGFPSFQNPGVQNPGFIQNPYGGSQSTSNANSNSFGAGPNGFGAANAQAQAQGNFSNVNSEYVY